MIRLVTFDALFTLVRPRRPIHVQYAEVFEPHLGSLPPDALKASFKTALKQLQQERPAYARGATEWWAEVIRRTALGAGADADAVNRILPRIVPALMHRFSSRDGYAFYPDALPTLRALQGAGVLTAVITNADARMRAVLDDLGTSVEDGDGKPLQLHPILISEEVGVEKPSPRIYASACEAASVTLEETLHVGDELEADYHGATHAGALALLLRRPGAAADGAPQRADEDRAGAHVVQSLDEVAKHVQTV